MIYYKKEQINLNIFMKYTKSNLIFSLILYYIKSIIITLLLLSLFKLLCSIIFIIIRNDFHYHYSFVKNQFLNLILHLLFQEQFLNDYVF